MDERLKKVILESPTGSAAQGLTAYVPIANSENLGIAAFSADDFIVDDGFVELKNRITTEDFAVAIENMKQELIGIINERLGGSDG